MKGRGLMFAGLLWLVAAIATMASAQDAANCSLCGTSNSRIRANQMTGVLNSNVMVTPTATTTATPTATTTPTATPT